MRKDQFCAMMFALKLISCNRVFAAVCCVDLLGSCVITNIFVLYAINACFFLVWTRYGASGKNTYNIYRYFLIFTFLEITNPNTVKVFACARRQNSSGDFAP